MKFIFFKSYVLVGGFFCGLACFAEINIQSIFSPTQILQVAHNNRATLALVDRWVSDSAYKNSFYNYGIPHYVRHLMDEPIGPELTYSDAIVLFSSLLKTPINYLEIGVSAGKNIFQVMNAIEHAHLVAIDLEDINPKLEEFLINKVVIKEFATINDSLKKNLSSITQYEYLSKQNKILYVSADLFDEQAWSHLQGKKFNLIFSDACHIPSGLLQEQSMIEKFELLDPEEFVLIWDDLGGEMTEAFLKIFFRLKAKYNLSNDSMGLLSLRGWIGVHEHLHTIGVIVKTKRS